MICRHIHTWQGAHVDGTRRRHSNLLCRMCRNVVSWTHAGGNWNRQSTLCGMCRNVLSWQVCRICRRVQRWHGARCWHGLRRQGARCGGTRNRRRKKGSSLSPEGECRICRNVLSWQGAHAGGSWIRQSTLCKISRHILS